MNQLTEQQHAACVARGNVLVAAGAGTGKTSTVTERCLELILHEQVDGTRCGIDQILMVTFTDAAAAEMRQRLRERLRQVVAASSPAAPSASRSAAPAVEPAASATSDARHLTEQLALLETANISTLHGFCLELVRRNFHQLGLDPACVVLDETQTAPLIHSLLDQLFLEHYAATSEASERVRELVRTYGRGSDRKIREWIVKLHRYSQTLPDPAAWFSAQTAAFSALAPTAWQEQFIPAVADWSRVWNPPISESAEACANLAICQAALHRLLHNPLTLPQIADELEAINQANTSWERGTAGRYRDPLKPFFEDAKFLSLLAQNRGAAFDEDWEWARHPMLVLLGLAQEFSRRFAQAKRELGGIDFADQEQFALRLLLTDTGQPTPIARACREKFAFVFVDECQDINAAQDAILRAVSREGAAANRFLVGDVKQSIYRFRLADPRIFQNYERTWAAAQPTPNQVLPLTENFRSAEGLLNFVNSVFTDLMGPAIGGLTYEREAQLRFGAAAARAAMAARADPGPRVDLHVLTRDDLADDNFEAAPTTADPNAEDLRAVEREARVIAMEFQRLKASGYQIATSHHGQPGFRPVEYADMVVLLRAATGKAEIFARAFHQCGIPLQANRAGFLDAQEIADVLNLLRLLDNPLQDLPLLAVLRSPFAGLTVEELAQMRIAAPKGLLWTAMQQLRASADFASTGWHVKLVAFHDRFHRWRELIRHAPLTHCLETALLDTHYEILLRTRERGAERVANVRRLVELARRFDPYQREGLFRFLRFVADQEAAGVEHQPAEVVPPDAVRLMTIHASKGLEFPIVAVAGLGSRFNLSDLNEDILLSETIGLAPRIVPPHSRSKYPSFAHWQARRQEQRARWGEELRLLYVALTRARDRLLLVGSTAQKKEIEQWRTPVKITDYARLRANSCLAWLRLWFAQHCAAGQWTHETRGQNSLLSWHFHGADAAAVLPPETQEVPPDAVPAMPSAAQRQEIQARIHCPYPHAAATVEPAKTTVTTLRRRIVDADTEETRPLFSGPAALRRGDRSATLSAAEIGTAHHLFLEFVNLARTQTELDLRNEATRLLASGHLSAAQVAELNFAGLSRFWSSELGERLRQAPPERINRELPFTIRLDQQTLRALGQLPFLPTGLSDEFMVVQGQIDIAVISPEQIWVVDFKTDAVDHASLPQKIDQYRPQLTIYATALEAIYRRPVTERWLHFFGLDHSVRLP